MDTGLVWSQTITPTLLLGVVMKQVNARSGHSSEELERVLDSIDSLLAKDRGPKGWPGSMVADGRLSPQAATEIGTTSTLSFPRNNITADLYGSTISPPTIRQLLTIYA